MADGDNTAGGMGMGMIIGLLLVLILIIGGGYYMFAGRGGSGPSAAVSIPSGTTVAGTVTTK
jgi:hypothetical protein